MINLFRHIFLVLTDDDIEYLLSHLDEEPQGSKAHKIREKIFEQAASRLYGLTVEELRAEEINHPITEIEK